jgi:hypothetical protein
MNLGELSRYSQGVEMETKTAFAERNIPLSERLKEKIKYHKEQIIKVEATLALLEKNQDIEKLIFMLNEIH